MKKKTPQNKKSAVSVKQPKKTSNQLEKQKKTAGKAGPLPKKQASAEASVKKGSLAKAPQKSEKKKLSGSDAAESFERKKSSEVMSSSAKKDAKAKANSPKKKAKREATEELGDEDFLMDESGDPGEMAEYEEELSEIEEQDEESEVEEIIVETEVLVTKESGSDDDVVLLDAEGRRYCRARDCDQAATVDGYCRYHYLLLWKKIQVRRKILADGKLERYVDELTARYPDKFLEVIRKDLRSEKDFLSAIRELEIDESQTENDFEEDTQLIDEVRGMGDSVGSGADVEDDF